MKKISILLVSFAIAAPLWAGPRTAKVKIDGMVCQSCTSHIESTMKKLDGVKACNVSLKKGEATIRLKKGASVAEGEIRKQVEKSGYKVKDFSWKKS